MYEYTLSKLVAQSGCSRDETGSTCSSPIRLYL